MKTKKIIESGFVKAFIENYYEDKFHNFYADKYRLLYVMCGNDLERQQVTVKQIEVTKNEIQKLGYENLSYAYLLSCKPESGVNYIKPENRFAEWLEIFKENFIDSIHSFTPILEMCERLLNELSIDDLETEFWQYYPVNQKPKIDNLGFIIQRENELMDLIEHNIYEFKKNECWEFDFDELKQFDEISKPIEVLFNISELFVQLNILEMFQDTPINFETETKSAQKKTEKLSEIITHDNSIVIVNSIKVRYKNIKGKQLKILLMVFQDLKLLPKERIAKKFYECCKNEFEWEIASYNAMNGYLFNENVDVEEFDTMKEYFETLIKSK